MPQVPSDTAGDQPSGRQSTLPESWSGSSLRELMNHIVQTHHPFCRTEGPRLELLFRQTMAADQGKHDELKAMYDLFAGMNKDLANHMEKEELTLFPYIARLESMVLSGKPVSWPPFGTVGNPIRIMIVEHGKTNIELDEMRKLSNGFQSPSDAPGPYTALYAALYEGLTAFDRDMKQHIALEEQVLFPRAVAMESEACSKLVEN